ncbi:hypothetical protein NKH77_40470 [Streptomyces sp. M19]
MGGGVRDLHGPPGHRRDRRRAEVPGDERRFGHRRGRRDARRLPCLAGGVRRRRPRAVHRARRPGRPRRPVRPRGAGPGHHPAVALISTLRDLGSVRTGNYFDLQLRSLREHGLRAEFFEPEDVLDGLGLPAAPGTSWACGTSTSTTGPGSASTSARCAPRWTRAACSWRRRAPTSSPTSWSSAGSPRACPG